MSEVPDSKTVPAGFGPWALLFGSLCLGGGHGVFVFFALSKTDQLFHLWSLGGRLNFAVVTWFVLCIPLALLAVLLRRALMGWRLLPVVASGTALATAGVFLFYLTRIVRVAA